MQIVLVTVIALVLGLLVVATVALSQLHRLKPWVNDRVSEATGRHFEIRGDLSAQWQWPHPLEDGWRRWVPGVTVKAQQMVMDHPPGFTPPFSRAADVSPGNAAPARGRAAATSARSQREASAPSAPASAVDGKVRNGGSIGSATAANADSGAGSPSSPRMATIESATASIRLWPLLARHLSIDTVALDHPDIALARAEDGTNNWTFQRKDPDAPAGRWTFDVDRLLISQGVLAYADGARELELHARVETTDPIPSAPRARAAAGAPGAAAAPTASNAAQAPAVGSGASAPAAPVRTSAVPYGLKFEVQGRYRKAEVQGSGRAGQVISLRDKVVDYPLQLDLSGGSLALSAEGVLANPGALSGMDFDVALRGASMADLFDVTGLVLPNTPPFQTRGRLTGSLEPERAVWNYSGFTGKVGQSDLQGDLRYTSAKPRPRLTGSMASNQLRLVDLGPTIGTNKPDNARRGRERGGQKQKVLPTAQFAAERWSAMDLDLTFRGKRIIRPESLPLQDLSLRAVLNNAQLKLSPLTFGVADGKIESNVDIDGRSAPLKAQIRGTVQGLKLSALFPKVELMKKSLGRMDGAVAMESRGNSMADLLGHGTGEARLYVRDGTLSKQLLELAALNVGSIIVGRLFGENREVRVRCAVADFTIVDGLAKTRIVKMSTEDAVVEATGTVNLATEEMNLRIKPESLEWKFLSLRTPLYVKGTFGDPDVGIEPGPLLLRAGAAVVAAVAAPAALALVPITVPAADDDTHCKPLLDLATEPVKPGQAGASGAASQPARNAASRPAAPARRAP